jgi:hypothetical protein
MNPHVTGLAIFAKSNTGLKHLLDSLERNPHPVWPVVELIAHLVNGLFKHIYIKKHLKFLPRLRKEAHFSGNLEVALEEDTTDPHMPGSCPRIQGGKVFGAECW